ncbi:MAG: SLBB domain-containing protein, partial [Mycetocola sp.]
MRLIDITTAAPLATEPDRILPPGRGSEPDLVRESDHDVDSDPDPTSGRDSASVRDSASEWDPASVRDSASEREPRSDPVRQPEYGPIPDPDDGDLPLGTHPDANTEPERMAHPVARRDVRAVLRGTAGVSRRRRALMIGGAVVAALIVGIGILAPLLLDAVPATPETPVGASPSAAGEQGNVADGAGTETGRQGASDSSPLAADGGVAGADGEATAVPIVVHVVGAVKDPGVFTVPQGSRVTEAIHDAGGFADDAEPGSVNLARVLSDGEQIVVAAQGESVPGAAPSSASAAQPAPGVAAVSGAKVNINTADAAALDALPGVGPATATQIVSHRD